MKKQTIAMVADTSSVDVDVALYAALPRNDYMDIHPLLPDRSGRSFQADSD